MSNQHPLNQSKPNYFLCCAAGKPTRVQRNQRPTIEQIIWLNPPFSTKEDMLESFKDSMVEEHGLIVRKVTALKLSKKLAEELANGDDRVWGQF